MTLRILIVDDEAPARRKLRALLAGDPTVEIVGESGSGPEAVEGVGRLHPDLVLLDIQMPGMTGLEVIEAIGVEAMPAVVFVTAYDEFALDAFEVNAVDYLLKPISRERLTRALQRVRERVERRDDEHATLARLLQTLRPPPTFLQRLTVRTGQRIFLVPISEVLRISAEGNYVEVHTASGTHLVRETMGSLEAQLDPQQFARVHRSEIINIGQVKEIQPYFHGDHVVILRNGQRVRMSRRYQDRLLQS